MFKIEGKTTPRPFAMTSRVKRSLITSLWIFFYASASTGAFVTPEVARSSHVQNRRPLRIEKSFQGMPSFSPSGTVSRESVPPNRRRQATTTTEKFQRRSNVLFSQPRRMLSDDSARFSSQSFYIDVTSDKKGFLEDWKDKLRRVSTFASLLCVIDCTLLPIVTVILPLLGLAGSPAHLAWIHELGHKMAMFFVLPVGGLAATMNYVSHKKLRISIPAAIGLLLVYLANAGSDSLLVSQLPHAISHAFHCGATHRITNIAGCALLLGSNYLSRQIGCVNDKCLDPNCVVENPHVRRYSQL
mmetsp:Transcript_4597/g.6784  ORF Transcript_4597/g.6784 Transcript_4597/m.6784 type:complete len:300 (+) Transcript_4597:3-902(+)